jgi:hypothetical protein
MKRGISKERENKNEKRKGEKGNERKINKRKHSVQQLSAYPKYENRTGRLNPGTLNKLQ